MPRYASRRRAAEAYELRVANYSWNEIRVKLNFRSVGAAQQAVNGHVARMGREPTSTSRAAREDEIRLRSRLLGERLAAAYVNGDDDRLVMLNRELSRNDSELARLQGLYAPTEVSVRVSSIEDNRAALLAKLERDTSALPAPKPAVIDAEVEEAG
jgi:hypothetical protein